MSTLDLAVIGNCAISSMIDKKGRHVWHCRPRFDGDPVFSSLLNGADPKQGFMDVLVHDFCDSKQAYIRNTAVVETILEDSNQNKCRLIDFAPRHIRFGRMFRPPMLIRRIEPLQGACRIKVRVRPHFEYGARKTQITTGSNHVRFVPDENSVIRLTSDMPLSYLLNETEFVLNRPVNLILSSDEPIPERPETIVLRFMEETINHWQEWVRGLAIPFDWQEAVIRAAITLKLCSYEDNGAIVAALTTSIPEAPGSTRNWDYRHCWLRDALFTVSALNRLGATQTMEGFIHYLLDNVLTKSDAPLSPIYSITAEPLPDEAFAPSLVGYRDMGPVRVGNAAVSQQQNDVYGSVILSAAQMFWDQRIQKPAGIDMYRLLCPIGEQALANALKPDAGIWEYRFRERTHTFSAAMCWAAIHSLGRIAHHVGLADEGNVWLAKASTLRTEILTRALDHENNWITGSFEGREADASLLLLPEIGFISADSNIYRNTLSMIEKRLFRNGYIMRYDEADDFGLPHTAFTVCAFWYIDSLVATGQREKALELFHSILERRNHVGLLSEDIDPTTGELWGNFPQTYSQVGLILSALRLSQTWEQGLWGALQE
ncbi:MAG: glycoside hydrolase family 15 protein [Alphaproteobacteria bacterium]|jgi:GH15 family glucan-1,4-alpha-glucosidase|nr:glycoside hydrolase family 15 protein [Alphaproteobacteria bacterium]